MIEELVAAASILCPDLDPLAAWSQKSKRIPLVIFGATLFLAGVASMRLKDPKVAAIADEEVAEDGVQDDD